MQAVLAAVAILVACCDAFAQQGRVYRLGYLGPGSPSAQPGLVAFQRELRERGYIEGKNLIVEYRWAEGRDDRLQALANELVRMKPDIVVVEAHTPAIQAAKRATTSIPIVMSVSGDPVGSGLVRSLARPGGNLTGLTVLSPELAGKRLELLREAVPAASRVAVVWNPSNPPKVEEWRQTEEAARKLGIKLQSLEVRSSADFDSAFRVAERDRPDALIAFSDGLVNDHRALIVKFAARNRLPDLYTYREFIVTGGLISYGPSQVDLRRRAAIYVDKILKGAKPGDLPIEQPEKFELIVNLKTAKALGMSVPKSVLMRADEVMR